MYKIKLVASAFFLITAYTSCTQTQKPTEVIATDSTSVAVTVPIELKDVNSDLAYDQYLHLKNVLVLSDSTQAQSAAKELAGTLVKISGSENSTKLAYEMASEVSLSKQRTIFTTLSVELITMFKKAEITSGSMFVQYCPMANDGEGGYWLASETEIRNPYYGDEMLNCGEVKETISKK
jgi:hypothetical protein